MADHNPTRQCESFFRETKDDIKRIEERVNTLSERMGVTEGSLKSVHKRMDAREEELKIIYKLAHSVESMTKTLGNVVIKLETHETRLTDLHYRPNKKVSDYVEKLFIYGACVVIGILIANALS